MSDEFKSHGRKVPVASAQPRPLIEEPVLSKGCWTARVITLFPELFPGALEASLTGKALSDRLWALQKVSLRNFGQGRHRNVDDTPAGGGAGMVLRADVMARALEEAQRGAPADRSEWPILYMSPRGRRLTHERAARLAQSKGCTIICGRFEGLDERVIDQYQIEEISIGDFVMTGGEIAAQALIDATVRLIPTVVGNPASVGQDSFADGLLEHPHYTRPAAWMGREIPEVLLSGHHGDIADWRQKMAERLTKERRPDLWRAYCATHGRDPNGDREL